MLSQKEKLDALTHLGIELNQISDLDILLERVLTRARQFANADAGSIYIRKGQWLFFPTPKTTPCRKNCPKMKS